MPERQPRTAAATAAVRRRGQETKARALREAGWIVLPPEAFHELPPKLLAQIVDAEKRWR